MYINDVIFNVDVETIITELQSQLASNGIHLLGHIHATNDNVMVCCPYHKGGQERRPSAGIKMSDGTFHCFTCNETHSLQEVVTHCFGHYDDIVGAFGWNWLIRNFVTIGIEERDDIEFDVSRERKTKTKQTYISEEELDSYRYFHPYMYKRKLTDEVIEQFDIGYDKKTQCITFPIRNTSGDTLFIARRSVNTKYFNYPQGAEKPLYGLYELYQLDSFPSEVIICESMLDALVFWTVRKYAVALNGLGSDLQFKQLNAMPCRKLILCTDSDDAGMKARERIKLHVRNKIISEYLLPTGVKDANDCTQEQLKNMQEIL